MRFPCCQAVVPKTWRSRSAFAVFDISARKIIAIIARRRLEHNRAGVLVRPPFTGENLTSVVA
jgi:hypothetical protein